jgi:hypothetical protein
LSRLHCPDICIAQTSLFGSVRALIIRIDGSRPSSKPASDAQQETGKPTSDRQPICAFQFALFTELVPSA